MARKCPNLGRDSIWLGWHVCRTKLARKIFFEARNFSRKMLRIPKIFDYFVGQKKSHKIPAKLPAKFPSQKSRKIHRRASAGAQGEHLVLPENRAEFSSSVETCQKILPALGSCRAGMAWKTAKSRKWKKKKMEIEMENGPKLGRGKNGQKMAQKMDFEGVSHYFSIFWPFFGHFCSCPAWGRFPFRFPFFFHFRLLAVFHAIPARQDPNSSKKFELQAPSQR